jgi:hypothetical protein
MSLGPSSKVEIPKPKEKPATEKTATVLPTEQQTAMMQGYSAPTICMYP